MGTFYYSSQLIIRKGRISDVWGEREFFFFGCEIIVEFLIIPRQVIKLFSWKDGFRCRNQGNDICCNHDKQSEGGLDTFVNLWTYEQNEQDS